MYKPGDNNYENIYTVRIRTFEIRDRTNIKM